MPLKVKMPVRTQPRTLPAIVSTTGFDVEMETVARVVSVPASARSLQEEELVVMAPAAMTVLNSERRSRLVADSSFLVSMSLLQRFSLPATDFGEKSRVTLLGSSPSYGSDQGGDCYDVLRSSRSRL